MFHRGEREPEAVREALHIHGDRMRLPEFRERFRDFNPEAVLDMRAMTQMEADLTVRSVEGIAERVVVVSSMDVYRAYDVLHGRDAVLQETPFSEDSELRERHFPYRSEPPRSGDDPQQWLDQYDKILVEQRFRQSDHLPATVLRLPAVYGPGDGQHRFFDVAKRLADGRQVFPMDAKLATWRFTHAYVEDVAAAIALAITDERATGKTYNVAEEHTPTRSTRTEDAAASVGLGLRAEVVPSEKLPPGLRIEGANLDQHMVGESSRIRRELQFAEVVTYEAALRRTIEWEQENPPATIDPAAFDYEAEDRALG